MKLSPSYLSVTVKPIHDEIDPPETNAVRYLKVSETDLYSIGVFVFPPNILMPIHDHPGMVCVCAVCSRLLDSIDFSL
jgi:predicted metal-dependent enzyme (double-stranded beta helix superfamily)